jgi:hypothetical protein
MCLYFYGVPQPRGANAVALMLASALLFVKVPFSTVMDKGHFWASLVLVFVTSGAFFVRHLYEVYSKNTDHHHSTAKIKNNVKNENSNIDACIFALAALTDSIYRTPENPYASILCIFLTIRQWLKVFCILTSSCEPYYAALDLILTTWYICFTVEVALLPQFTHPEDWPIYGGAAVYATFAAACYTSNIKINF